MFEMYCFSSSIDAIEVQYAFWGLNYMPVKNFTYAKKNPNILNFKHKWQQVLSAYKCKGFNLYLHFKGWGPWQ